jgi:hypothetical protein
MLKKKFMKILNMKLKLEKKRKHENNVYKENKKNIREVR